MVILHYFKLKKPCPTLNCQRLQSGSGIEGLHVILSEMGLSHPEEPSVYTTQGCFLVLIQLVEGEWVAGVEFNEPGGCVMMYRTP